MKTKISIYLIGIIALLGCEKELDTVNPNEISQDSFWSSPNDAELALAGVYDAIQDISLFGGRFREFDGYGGIGYYNWNTDALTITEGGSTPETNEYLLIWLGHYTVVNRANTVIYNTESVEDLSETRSSQIIAEARFLRALAYLDLTFLYRDVPLILKDLQFSERFVSKKAQEEIKTAILDDADFAAENLPDQWSGGDQGRVDKWGALALKARANLYFGNWDEAAEAALEIIESGKFGLYDDFSELFLESGQGSVESIFAVRFETGLGEGESFSGTYKRVTQGTLRVLPEYVNSFYCSDGLPIDQSPLYDPADSLNNRDPRLEATILHSGELWINGNEVFNTNSPTGFDIQKYQRNVLGYYYDGPQDFMVFRYADVLLMRAEALIEMNQLTQEVYDLINEVRQRPSVNMPIIEDVEGSGLAQNQLREIVRHERLAEFGFEGLRFFDIKRWGIVQEVYEFIKYHNRLYDSGKTEVWPIPQTEVDNNPNLEQHPEWL